LSDDVARWAGQLLLTGFEGSSLPAWLEARLRNGSVGGAIVFKWNLTGDPWHTASLATAITGNAPPDRPALVAVDQEGGRVQRVRAPATEWPPMAALGLLPESRGEEIARRVGAALGAELAALGFSWDFAPVLDVATNPENPVIGDRALSTDAVRVARLGIALAMGLEEDAGVAACGKHFPGHGDTSTDSHFELPVLRHDLARLRRIELAPFAAAARAGLSSIMTAHILFPELDSERPATLSRPILRLLREELGYRGVIVSDDLEMKAVADRYAIEELVILGIEAGCDLFLVRTNAELGARAFEALCRQGEKDPSFRERLRESAARVASLKARFARGRFVPDRDRLTATLGSAAHQALRAELSAALTTAG
jgi:beta-N-acetylhexosaminidase